MLHLPGRLAPASTLIVPGAGVSVAEANRPRKDWLLWLAAGGAGIILLAAAAVWLWPTPQPAGTAFIISQKNRRFNPVMLTVRAGDTVVVVNDDADLHHHAYVSAKTFKFDSGDQSPGSRTPIRFAVPGHFNVLCGIHPKMRLSVTVQ